MKKPANILKDVFGYDSFRPLQSEIIENILNKKDTLVIMPTGGGKSLCYQVPALIFSNLTIVISPLISLMKDQVMQLQQLGIEAALLNSSLSREFYKRNYENVKNKKAKLLYLAPESLSKNEIMSLLSEIKPDCITVDEAHCISEWGHDFRKEYRQLGNLRQAFPTAVCLGLTATATPRVQDDIVKNLKLKSPGRFVASFNRKNLFLEVRPKKGSLAQTVQFLNEHKNQPGIIYCTSRKQVDSLSDKLKSYGFLVKSYHAGLTDEERNTNQELFAKDKVQIIVATIAFGMGINKSNVRFILHHDLPKNIESYYQQIGRAGRDGLKADCLLLFSYSDIVKINYFIRQIENPVEKKIAQTHLNSMVKYAEYMRCRRKPLINYFGEDFDYTDCKMCDNCAGTGIDKTDITVAAQKFLSAIKRTGEIFGAGYIIDLLVGKDTPRILEYNHQFLPVFGAGTEYTKKQWQFFSRQFISLELINRDAKFGSLKLTESALQVLFKGRKIFGYLAEPEKKLKRYRKEELSYNEELFEKLRQKRRELADIKNIPPYVIFSDKSLVEMAAYYPLDKQSLLEIYGIGKRKYENYGNIFLAVIRHFVKKNKIISGTKIKSENLREGKRKFELVGEAFNSGSSIDKLAGNFEVKTNTIISNLELFVNNGNALNTNELGKNLKISPCIQKEILNEFINDENVRLKKIFDKFNGEVSYDDIHIIRIIYKSAKLDN